MSLRMPLFIQGRCAGPRAGRSRLQQRLAALGRLDLQHRLALSAVLALLPLLTVLSVWLHQEWTHWQRDRHAQQGAEVVAPSLQLLSAWHAAAQAAGPWPAGATQRLQQAMVAVDRSVAEADGRLGLLPLWQPLRQRLHLAASGRGTSDPALGADLVHWPAMVAEHSGMLTHRDRTQLALASLRSQWVPAWLEGLASAATVPPGSAAADTPAMQAPAPSAALGATLRQAALQIDILARDQTPPPARWQPARSATERLQGLGALTAQADGAARQAFQDAAHSAAAELLRLDAELALQLQQRLARQQTLALWRLTGVLGLCLLCWGALGWLALTFARRFRAALNQVQTSLDAVASGDMCQSAAVRGHDELAGMGAGVERMAAQLSALVAEIRSSAVRLGQAGQAVADDGQGLSNRSDQQIASLHAAVEQVAQVVRGSDTQSEAAHTLGALVGNLREQVKGGGELVGDTVSAILTLETTARRVAEVNNVIDDIAFQTNLLALNASVEAARAGEAGKGFAVVAAEVRQLALRCAEAAAEVRQLIDCTTDQVSEASSRVQQARAQLAGVDSSVQVVSRRIGALSEQTVEQQQCLSRVRDSVASLVQLSLDNQSALSRSTGASRTMAQQAGALQRAVATMRLRQGTADEAQDLVLRALQHVGTVGEPAAFDDFNRGADGWLDRDLYLFALDRAQRYRVAGGRPAWLGRSTYELPGVRHAQADAFLKLAWAAAERGGDWIDYDGADPVTHEPVPKSAYVLPLGEDMFIGCAVHRSHADGRLNVSRVLPMSAPNAPHAQPRLPESAPPGEAIACR